MTKMKYNWNKCNYTEINDFNGMYEGMWVCKILMDVLKN